MRQRVDEPQPERRLERAQVAAVARARRTRRGAPAMLVRKVAQRSLIAWRAGDAYDNAMAESFVDSFKTELICDRVWKTRGQLELAVVGWGGWYNHDRLHSALDQFPQPNTKLSTLDRTTHLLVSQKRGFQIEKPPLIRDGSDRPPQAGQELSYRADFEAPLDLASWLLRGELKLLLGSRGAPMPEKHAKTRERLADPTVTEP